MEPRSVEEGRAAYRSSEWSLALAILEPFEGQGELAASDLELLATTRFMIGDIRGMLDTLERAHDAYRDSGDVLPAVRTAGWLGANYAAAGKLAQANGWIERAERLADQVEGDCVERGYLLLPTMLKYLETADLALVVPMAEEARAVGVRFGDADLVALAGHLQGRALMQQGMTREAIRVLDETMIAVTAGRLTPRVTGLVYCGVVECCFEIHEITRAAEWTNALSAWVDAQPDLVAFTDQCLAHRSEILRLQGAWDEAMEEARLANGPRARPSVSAQASYQEAEIHRLRGQIDLAELAYKEVGLKGVDPQPGLALVRAAQGNLEAARSSLTRALAEIRDPAEKTVLLAAHVEVLLADGDQIGARAAAEKLSGIAERTQTGMHLAWAATGRGQVALAQSTYEEALQEMRDAARRWAELNVPYELARARCGAAEALAGLGDSEAADVELEAAEAIMSGLGATPDLERIEALRGRGATVRRHGLTGREMEILRWVTTGASNRVIAEQLVLSERTVDRHVSNIYTKLGVSSRAAATALAIKSQLV